MPLTGLPITDPALAARRRWSSRSTTTPTPGRRAASHQADLVYEENVEQLTRFAAVFQTQRARTRSGRSAPGAPRTSMLLGSLDQPMFAWSGGNGGVTAAINGSDFFVVQRRRQ